MRKRRIVPGSQEGKEGWEKSVLRWGGEVRRPRPVGGGQELGMRGA